eukprot:3813435-Heterocapsa_arctica.AAC.1
MPLAGLDVHEQLLWPLCRHTSLARLSNLYLELHALGRFHRHISATAPHVVALRIIHLVHRC